jgi:hypothetical protein
MGTDWSFGILKYGDLWRDHRRVFYSFFSATEVPQFYPVIEEEVAAFLKRLSTHPRDFYADTRV